MIPDNEYAYGGFWLRFGAFCVDAAIMLIPSLLISFLVRAANPPTNASEQFANGTVDFLFQILCDWVYSSAFWSSAWQATPGKRICGLKVVDYGGGRISFGRASGRYFAKFLSALILFIGFFMIAWTKKRQGLH